MFDEREKRKLPHKTCWVIYGLQGLSPEKFLNTVQKIIDGKLVLLKPPEILTDDLETSEECSLSERRIGPPRA